jgi:3-phytase
MRKRFASAFLATALLGACATPVPMINYPAVDIPAAGQTDPVGTSNADAADDPAFWVNPANPAASIIVGTDKKAGLYSYGLDGSTRHFINAGLLNNVDLWPNANGALVAASDRNDPLNAQIALFDLDVEGRFIALGKVPAGKGEAYGICVQRGPSAPNRHTKTPDHWLVYAANKDGTVHEISLTRGHAGFASHITQSWKLPTQVEGCVTNPENGDLYIGEEDAGIWRIRTGEPNSQPELFARVGADDGLVADVEGLAFAARDGKPDLLIASSQGDNAYAVLDAGTGVLLGRFRIGGGTIGGNQETDGIDLIIADGLPGYPGGIFMAQDGDNAPFAQNFKMIGWQTILDALGLVTR